MVCLNSREVENISYLYLRVKLSFAVTDRKFAETNKLADVFSRMIRSPVKDQSLSLSVVEISWVSSTRLFFSHFFSRTLDSIHISFPTTMMSCRLLSASTASRSIARSFSTTRNVVIVSGVRLPFATTASGLYKDELAVDLQRLAFQGLFTETALPKDQVDYVICGNVIQEVRTSNIAREAAINAGLPVHVGAHTIAQVRRREREIYCALCTFLLLGSRFLSDSDQRQGAGECDLACWVDIHDWNRLVTARASVSCPRPLEEVQQHCR